MARTSQLETGDQEIAVCNFVTDPVHVTLMTLRDLFFGVFWSDDLGPYDAAWNDFKASVADIFDNWLRMEDYLAEWSDHINSDTEFIARHALWVAVLLQCPDLEEDSCVRLARFWLISGARCSHNPDYFETKDLKSVPLAPIRSVTTDDVQATASLIAQHLDEIRTATQSSD